MQGQSASVQKEMAAFNEQVRKDSAPLRTTAGKAAIKDALARTEGTNRTASIVQDNKTGRIRVGDMNAGGVGSKLLATVKNGKSGSRGQPLPWTELGALPGRGA